MKNRNKLITYALMCDNDYEKTKKMVLENPEVKDLSEGVKAITILDDDYPKDYFLMKYPPFVLFKDRTFGNERTKKENAKNINFVTISGKVLSYEHDHIVLENEVVIEVPFEMSCDLIRESVEKDFRYEGKEVVITGTIKARKLSNDYYEDIIVADSVKLVK